MLTNRKTRLKFDDYVSGLINIDNGIGQGDPLSMLLYLFYNADLFDLARNSKEDATGYVDDASILATGKTFSVCHRKIGNMMSKEGGATEWSLQHNSPWELSKSVYVDYSRDKKMKRPALQIAGNKIKKVTAHKQVGVFLDEGLRWHEQETHTIAKITRWTNRLAGFSKTTKGMPAKFVRRLYQAVAIPKMTYAADVWYTPLKRSRLKQGKHDEQDQLLLPRNYRQFKQKQPVQSRAPYGHLHLNC